jgi:hypothetical protein
LTLGPYRPVAQFSQDTGQLDAPVEIRARDVHAMVGEDVVLAVQAGGALRADAHDREVGGAPAYVGHQHELLALHVALVVEGGGDGLVLEVQLLEAHGARGLLERGLGLAVAHGVVVDEEHRPAQDRTADRRAGLGFGARFRCRR